MCTVRRKMPWILVHVRFSFTFLIHKVVTVYKHCSNTVCTVVVARAARVFRYVCVCAIWGYHTTSNRYFVLVHVSLLPKNQHEILWQFFLFVLPDSTKQRNRHFCTLLAYFGNDKNRSKSYSCWKRIPIRPSNKFWRLSTTFVFISFFLSTEFCSAHWTINTITHSIGQC